jgi:hypothetical protein
VFRKGTSLVHLNVTAFVTILVTTFFVVSEKKNVSIIFLHKEGIMGKEMIKKITANRSLCCKIRGSL